MFSESGDGADDPRYASVASNRDHPLWHVEPGSSPVARVDGNLRKVDSRRFHRMFSTERFGGPGTTVTIAYRARATAIRHRSSSTVVEGAKVGMKWPVDRSETGYATDDPRSVEGTSEQESAASPGSYAFVTGLTRDGYIELARNGYGSDGYTFFPNDSAAYSPGEWKDVVVQLDWLDQGDIRVRYWHGEAASGAPVYDVTDRDSPFWDEPGYLWLRTDDADWEYDFVTVHERPSEVVADDGRTGT